MSGIHIINMDGSVAGVLEESTPEQVVNNIRLANYSKNYTRLLPLADHLWAEPIHRIEFVWSMEYDDEGYSPDFMGWKAYNAAGDEVDEINPNLPPQEVRDFLFAESKPEQIPTDQESWTAYLKSNEYYDIEYNLRSLISEHGDKYVIGTREAFNRAVSSLSYSSDYHDGIKLDSNLEYVWERGVDYATYANLRLFILKG